MNIDNYEKAAPIEEICDLILGNLVLSKLQIINYLVML
jgi:hypothetical protein